MSIPKTPQNPPKISGPSRVFFGQHKHDGAQIYISKPTFDCGWYWSFGYLGNKNEHYHLNSFRRDPQDWRRIRDINMHDALLADYELSPLIEKNLWAFCELSRSIYILKDTAGLFHIGEAHDTTNPLAKLLQNRDLYDKVTFEFLPPLLQELCTLIIPEEETPA